MGRKGPLSFERQSRSNTTFRNLNFWIPIKKIFNSWIPIKILNLWDSVTNPPKMWPAVNCVKCYRNLAI